MPELLDFQKILNEIARKRDGRHHSKLENKFSPTGLVSCIRNSYYSILFPEPYDDRSFRNFLIGNMFHEIFQDNLDPKDPKNVELLQKLFGDKIEHIESEKGYLYMLPLSKTDGERILVSGRLDTIFFLKDEAAPVIVDFKTTSNGYYNKDKPKLEHVKQLNFYLATNGSDYGYIVYIDKRSGDIFQHKVEYSKELFEELESNAIALFKAMKAKAPPIVNVKAHFEAGTCHYCLHKAACKQYEITLKKAPAPVNEGALTAGEAEFYGLGHLNK